MQPARIALTFWRPDDRRRLAGDYLRRGMECVKRIPREHFADQGRFAQLDQDPQLSALRGFEEFHKWWAEMEGTSIVP